MQPIRFRAPQTLKEHARPAFEPNKFRHLSAKQRLMSPLKVHREFMPGALRREGTSRKSA
jgi:hypothetical protein